MIKAENSEKSRNLVESRPFWKNTLDTKLGHLKIIIKIIIVIIESP